MALKVDATAEDMFWQIVSGLRTAREDAGLSRRALALRLRVQPGTIFEWEKGISRPSLRNLILWARDLGFRLVIVDPDGNERHGPSKRIMGEPFEIRELRRLATLLKGLRVARGFTHMGVSGAIGVARNSLQRWESISATPRLMALIVWAQSLGCRVVLQHAGGRSRALGHCPRRP